MLGLQSDKSGGAAVEHQASLYYKLIDSIPPQQSSPSLRNRSTPAEAAVAGVVTVAGGVNGRIPMSDFMDLKSLKLVVPMRDKPNCDFSYAGESAIVYMHRHAFIRIYSGHNPRSFLVGLKNSFRMAVVNMRSLYGLDTDSTNAPGQQMEAVEEVVVRYTSIQSYSYFGLYISYSIYLYSHSSQFVRIMYTNLPQHLFNLLTLAYNSYFSPMYI